MLCKFEKDSLKVCEEIAPDQLIVKGESFCINLEWNYMYLPKDIKKEIRKIVKFANQIRMLLFLNPDNAYIASILEPYNIKYKGKTIYWWLKKVLNGKMVSIK